MKKETTEHCEAPQHHEGSLTVCENLEFPNSANTNPAIFELLKGGKVSEIRENDISAKDVLIGVIGHTGAGSSSFIAKATGARIEDNPIRPNTMEPRTVEIKVYKFSHPQISDRNLVFIDTPGFQGESIANSDVKDKIKTLIRILNKTRPKGENKFNGLLYLHDITQTRVPNALIQDFEDFMAVCKHGVDVPVFVTTKWNKLRKEADGTAKERQLIDGTLKPGELKLPELIKSSGIAHFGRFYHDQISAFATIRAIINHANQNHRSKTWDDIQNFLDMPIPKTGIQPNQGPRELSACATSPPGPSDSETAISGSLERSEVRKDSAEPDPIPNGKGMPAIQLSEIMGRPGPRSNSRW
ncbi:hypothetical protein CPB83DRAFT_845541 [Crepidotus variabilis]|uniref:G domain-containing protein n=1 Tax=Crepidotus variabilis TaxID=179855 RepID=A0A9P6JV81_9AGAR|nr:hypothetical protein CPB83DRAFT_845541 [Crepidotus variabilis]